MCIYICIHIHMIVNHLNWVDSIKTLHLPKVCQSVRAGMCRWAWEDGTEGWAQNVGRASNAWWVEGALCPELHCITKSGEGWGKFFFFYVLSQFPQRLYWLYFSPPPPLFRAAGYRSLPLLQRQISWLTVARLQRHPQKSKPLKPGTNIRGPPWLVQVHHL